MFRLFTAAERGHRKPGLDLIRGIAVAMVMLEHAWPGVFPGAGIVGVVIFFALSGYLITGLLERDLREYGRIRYARFYLHRAFRLMPPLIAVLAVFAVVEGAWNIIGARHEILRTIVVALTYTMNLGFFDRGSAALRHLWTLATEEQFYILWPTLFAFACRRGRIRLVIGSLLLAVLAICALTIVAAGPDAHKVYTLPTSWAAGMVLGCLAKVEEPLITRWMKWCRPGLVGAACLAVLIFLGFATGGKESALTYLVEGPVVAIASVGLIFEYAKWDSLPSRFLRPLLGLGIVSYAAYLWNFLIVSWMGGSRPDFFFGSATILLTITAAVISWYLLEQPAANFRARLEATKFHRSPTVVDEVGRR